MAAASAPGPELDDAVFSAEVEASGPYTEGLAFEADLLAACREAEGAYAAQIDAEREAAAIDQAALEENCSRELLCCCVGRL